MSKNKKYDSDLHAKEGSSTIGAQNERRETVAEIAARLSQGEDFRLAYNLQEEEFRSHFSKNKEQRMNMAMDSKISREQYLTELEKAEKKKAELSYRDQQMAKELAQRLEKEEERKRIEQAKLDAELARKLQFL